MEGLLKADANARSEAPHEIEFRPLEPDDPRALDPRFLPRVSLGLDGALVVTARSLSEAEVLMAVAFYIAKNQSRFKREPPRAWSVPAGVDHSAAIYVRENDDLRIVSKVAFGVALCRLGVDSLRGPGFNGLRAFLTEGIVQDSRSARRILPGRELSGWPDHHVAVVERRKGRLRGIVVLSGLCYEIALGSIEGEEVIGAAVSRRDGTETFLVRPDQARSILETVDSAISNHRKYLASSAS